MNSGRELGFTHARVDKYEEGIYYRTKKIECLRKTLGELLTLWCDPKHLLVRCQPMQRIALSPDVSLFLMGPFQG